MAMEISDRYRQLRKELFSIPLRSDVDFSADASGTYAALLEMSFENLIVALLTVCEGTTSVYFSDGGGIVGAGEDRSLRSEAIKLTSGIGALRAQMLRNPEPLPPKAACVQFSLIHKDGVLSRVFSEDELLDPGCAFYPAFEKAMQMITAIQEIEEQSTSH